MKLFFRSLIISLVVISILTGIVLRTYFWRIGGPDWAYWVGEFLKIFQFIILGLVFSIGMALSSDFIRKLYFLRRSFPKYIVSIHRLLWFLIGVILLCAGILSLRFTIQEIISNCPAPGC